MSPTQDLLPLIELAILSWLLVSKMGPSGDEFSSVRMSDPRLIGGEQEPLAS